MRKFIASASEAPPQTCEAWPRHSGRYAVGGEEGNVSLTRSVQISRTNKMSTPRVLRLLLVLCLLAFISDWSAARPPHGPVAAIALTRIYHPGRRLVYRTLITAHASIQSIPPALKAFLSEIPRGITIQEKNTLTVGTVLSDGSTEVRTRFDVFRILTQGNWANAPDGAANSRIEEDLSRHITGQVLTVHYDRNGNVLGLSGAQPLLQPLEVPTRNAAELVLRALLTEFGGSGFYTRHLVRPGDTWERKTATSVDVILPASFKSETIFQYRGLTRYHGIDAAVVGFRFTDSLKPRMVREPRGSPPAPHQPAGFNIDIAVTGGGNGRALVALSDGRILQKDSTFQENLRGSLKGIPGLTAPASGPATVDVRTQDSVQMRSE